MQTGWEDFDDFSEMLDSLESDPLAWVVVNATVDVQEWPGGIQAGPRSGDERSSIVIQPAHQDVVRDARKLLHESPFPELHGVDVEQRGEQVCLRGEVRTYFLKQVAQETVRSATRGLEVSNELLVNLRRRVH